MLTDWDITINAEMGYLFYNLVFIQLEYRGTEELSLPSVNI
ncbi:MAG: hypothetical protein RL713_1549 [Bacteroidota bacterium]|jgi:hypothetical protein